MGLPEEGGASRVISPQPSTLTGTRDSHGGCVNRAHTRPPDLARFHQPLCCLMASESFGCHDISRHRWDRFPRRESRCPLRWQGAVAQVAPGVAWAQCTRVGCYWRRFVCTPRRSGFRSTHNPWPVHPHPRGVGRPGDGGQAGRRCVDTTGTRDRRQVGRMGAEVPGPTTKTPRSRSRQQPSVHSADINGPDVDAHSGDRWNSAVVLRDSTPVWC